MSKPKVNIKGGISNFERIERKEKLTHSTFLLTLNTNQRYKTDDPHLKGDTQEFDNTLNGIMNNIEDYVKILTPHDEFNKSVESVDFDYAVELSSKTHTLHAHILVKFSHRTRLQLDFIKIRDVIKKELGLPSIHLNNRFIRSGQVENIIDYIDKMKY